MDVTILTIDMVIVRLIVRLIVWFMVVGLMVIRLMMVRVILCKMWGKMKRSFEVKMLVRKRVMLNQGNLMVSWCFDWLLVTQLVVLSHRMQTWFLMLSHWVLVMTLMLYYRM